MLKEYLNRTASIRNDINQLFITTTNPTKAASRDTIHGWTKILGAELELTCLYLRLIQRGQPLLVKLQGEFP